MSQCMLNQVISNISACFQDPLIFISSLDQFLQIGSFITIQDSNVNEQPNPTITVQSCIPHSIPINHASQIIHTNEFCLVQGD